MQYWPNTSCYFLPVWSVIFQKLVIIMSLVWAKIELNSEMKCFCTDPSFFPTLLALMLTRPEAVMFVIQSVACCSSPMRFFHLSPTVSLRSFPTRGRGPGPAPPSGPFSPSNPDTALPLTGSKDALAASSCRSVRENICLMSLQWAPVPLN